MALNQNYAMTDSGWSGNKKITPSSTQTQTASSTAAKKNYSTARKTPTQQTTQPAQTTQQKSTKRYYSSNRSSGSGYNWTPTYNPKPAEDKSKANRWDKYLAALQNYSSQQYSGETSSADEYRQTAYANLDQAQANYQNAYNTAKANLTKLAQENAQREQNINNAIKQGYDAMMGNANEYYKNVLGTYDRSMGHVDQGYEEGRQISEDTRDEAIALAEQLYGMGEESQNRQTERDLKSQYISYMNGMKNLGQRLKAQGINGGATETTALGALNGYEGNRSDIQEARLEALGALRQQQMQSTSEAEQAYLNALANLAQSRTQNQLAVENTRASGESSYAGMKNEAESTKSNQTVTAQNNFQNWANNLTQQSNDTENNYANNLFNIANGRNTVAGTYQNAIANALANQTANAQSQAMMTALEKSNKGKVKNSKSSKKKSSKKSSKKKK